jgi:hypothetical protein
MSSVGSPSARRREHIRGTWDYNVDLSIGRERTVHSVKQIVGAPIPWLVLSLPVFLASSKTATEIASWGLAFLILSYIASDSFAQNREFRFFRIGPDITLASCFAIGLFSIVSSQSLATNFNASAGSNIDSFGLIFEGLGQLRWIPLLYLFVYAWELFPGLNRLVLCLIGAATTISLIAWVQHFQGIDWVSGEALQSAPTGGARYFVARGFFDSAETLAIFLACVLPFPFAAACLGRETDEMDRTTWFGFGLAAFISLALIFTYRPEFWWAGLAGFAALLMFPGERRMKFIFAICASILAIWSIFVFAGHLTAETGTINTSTQGNVSETPTSGSIWNTIVAEYSQREEVHRAHMNKLVTIWEQSPLLGVSGAVEGLRATGEKDASASPEGVNVYFLILARGGILGLIAYLGFVLHHLLNTLRLFYEIPASHHKHRILVAGCFASQCAFHVCGLFWNTMTEAISMNLFILVGSISLYMTEHYALGLVPDDNAL